MNAEVGKVIPIVEPPEAETRNARVSAVAGREVSVIIANCQQMAKIAFSCLVLPLPGDAVLCSRDERGHWFVLGILERPESQDMVLSFPEKVVMHAKSATLMAEQNLNFFSAQEIHKSEEAVVDVKQVTATGENLQATYQKVQLVSQLISTMARNMFSRAKNYLRHTADHDQIKAGQLSRKAEGLYCMDSKHTIMVSKKDTKIDGERIHMG